MIKPLSGLKVVEFEGLGPAPVAGYFFQQLGAEVHLVSRPRPLEVIKKMAGDHQNPLNKGKIQHLLDVKNLQADRLTALELIRTADALIEGNRPGVMERLGLGPIECAEANPRLVYGRMTGWGQDGPLAQAAGHDLNYVALSGLLSLSQRRGSLPVVPPTVLGDGVGGLGLAFGIVSAYLEASRTGKGIIVDAAIVDITASVGILAQWLTSLGQLGTDGPNVAQDAPFYEVFECSCGRFVSICAVEAEFFEILLSKLGISDIGLSQQFDVSLWPSMKNRLAQIFIEKSRDHWCALLEGSDACFAPVLTVQEATQHPHIIARGIFDQADHNQIARVGPKFMGLSPVVQ